MTFLITHGGGKGGGTSYGRPSAEDALQFAYSLERMGEAKIKITNTATGQTYSIAQFERLIQGVTSSPARTKR